MVFISHWPGTDINIVIGHLYRYIALWTTLANEMNFDISHAPGSGSINEMYHENEVFCSFVPTKLNWFVIRITTAFYTLLMYSFNERQFFVTCWIKNMELAWNMASRKSILRPWSMIKSHNLLTLFLTCYLL